MGLTIFNNIINRLYVIENPMKQNSLVVKILSIVNSLYRINCV